MLTVAPTLVPSITEGLRLKFVTAMNPYYNLNPSPTSAAAEMTEEDMVNEVQEASEQVQATETTEAVRPVPDISEVQPQEAVDAPFDDVSANTIMQGMPEEPVPATSSLNSTVTDLMSELGVSYSDETDIYTAYADALDYIKNAYGNDPMMLRYYLSRFDEVFLGNAVSEVVFNPLEVGSLRAVA